MPNTAMGSATVVGGPIGKVLVAPRLSVSALVIPLLIVVLSPGLECSFRDTWRDRVR